MFPLADSISLAVPLLTAVGMEDTPLTVNTTTPSLTVPPLLLVTFAVRSSASVLLL